MVLDLRHRTTETTAEPSGSRPRRDPSVTRCIVVRNRLEVHGDIAPDTVDIVRAGFVEALHDLVVDTIDLRNVTLFGSTAISLMIEFALHRRHVVIASPLIERTLGMVHCQHLITEVDVAPSTA